MTSPSTTDLLDLRGIGQRSASFDFDVLDKSLNRVGSLQPDYTSPPTIENNVNRTIKRTLSGLSLPPGTWEDLDLGAVRVRPVMRLENGEAFNLGVFLFGDASKLRSTEGKTLSASLVDQALMIDQGVPTSVGVAPATQLDDAINTLLVASPVPSWYITPTTKTTGAAWLVWPAGESLMKILNDLAAMAGYYSPYFDNDGIMQFVPVPDLAALSTLASVTYSSGLNVFAGSIAESEDLLSAPNRYIVTDTSATDAPVTGFWDVPDDAPHSFARRGFYVTKVTNMQGLASAADATAAAMAEGQQDSAGLEHVEFNGPPDPRHDTFDVVDYQIGDPEVDGKYREQSWSMQLIEGADMHHSLRRVYGVQL